jgi:predicted pyridoxine 5'-phosphate oxidase superfamily flavin-nucleotide-binding protein
MTYEPIRKIEATVIKNKILFIVLVMIGGLLFNATNLKAQTPSPTPSDGSATIGDYDVVSSIEMGVRGLKFDGSDQKFRSDLNYRPGFRVFESSFFIETKNGKGKPFDSLLVTSSGWSADPSGFVRVNAEKNGAYSFNANVRRVNLINRVSNLILGFHPSDTRRYFGDFDLTVFPQSEKLRLRFGTSFYNARGDRGSSHRTRDVFPITERLRSDTIDVRGGIDTKLAGFNLSFTAGFRDFEDRGRFVVESRQVGVAGSCYFGVCISPTDVNFLNRLERQNPTEGDTKYGMFSMQRTFAKKLDLTGRFIYSTTDRTFNILDNINYDGQIRYTQPSGSSTNSPNLFVDADTYEIGGRSNRPQSRGDIGVTYAATDSFRISNTFTFDQYNSFGDSNYYQKFIARCQVVSGSTCPVAGGPWVAGLPGVSFLDTRTLYWYSYGFKRFTNTIEGDYQFNNKVGINIGYRYTHRKVSIAHVNRTVDDFVNRPITAAFTSADDEEEENTGHILLFGTKIKPAKNWSIFADGEHGQADNSFIRLANNDYTNFRVRSNWNYKQFAFNVSGIIRNNQNPSRTSDYTSTNATTGVVTILLPAFDITANVRNRIFSAYVDYVPDPRWTISTGYTYNYLTSKTDLVVPLSLTVPPTSFLRGFSEFYMKDNYFFFDVTANPVNRLSFFASYRYNKDNGQGTRVSALAERIISSYPFQSHVPEFRMAIKLTNNIDWNLGYQYNDYKENLRIGYYHYNELANTNVIPPNSVYAPNQNYRAHLPYTSLRIYFGRGAGAR